ncbi:hypothetical protein HNY73_020069 [Argiope bruennichi]|uniref:Gustatory receptor n=1 Tax=Argiope bruennichi TaxID=94029 RepID=A0A8T0E6Q9_ARGBR|nr:hypothetical protein HNY73_020069 [Argiope bruennichi]
MLATLDSIIVLTLKAIKEPEFRLLTLYMNNYIFGLSVWIDLRRRKNFLSTLLQMHHEIRPFVEKNLTNTFVYFINFLLAIQSITFVCANVRGGMAEFYAYGYPVTSPYNQVFLILFKAILYNILYPIFPTLMTFLLALICHRISSQIRDLTSEISEFSPEEFSNSKQMAAFNCKRKIDEALFILQKVFSFPSLLLCTSHFICCCIHIGWFILLYNSDKIWALKINYTIAFMNSAISLLVFLWAVGGLPLEMEAFKNEFRRKLQHRLILRGKADEIDLGKALNEEPTFVLSGCGIVYFRRSTILSLIASIITYTLLLLNTDQ